MKRIITAKYNSKCSETGQPVKKGDTVMWIKERGMSAVYCEKSKTFKAYNEFSAQVPDPGEIAAERWSIEQYRYY